MSFTPGIAPLQALAPWLVGPFVPKLPERHAGSCHLFWQCFLRDGFGGFTKTWGNPACPTTELRGSWVPACP
jgi:hypothetical protein